MNPSLTGQKAIVTGASSGIGKAIALALAAAGAEVIVAARRSDKLEQVVAEIAAVGGIKATAVACDVSSEASVAGLYAAAADRWDMLDLVVNNAGTLALHPIDEMPVEDWDRVIATNLRGPFLSCRAALRMMKPHRRGRIINIGSLSSFRVRAGNAAYNASKFGLEGLTHSVAIEGRAFGITCSAIHPGTTRSEITDYPGFPEKLIEATDVARVAVLMAAMPPDVNLFQAVIHPADQLYIGRG